MKIVPTLPLPMHLSISGDPSPKWGYHCIATAGIKELSFQ